MKLTVGVNDGTLAGRTYDLETGFLTIGRGENCSIRFDPQRERVASKQHAFIEARADGYYLTDNQSTNGTLLNGDRIQETRKLSSGDTIQFGRNGATATVHIADSHGHAEPTPSPQAFEHIEAEQFQQIAERQPVNVQNSITSLGLGSFQSQLQQEPEKKQTGKYAGIAVVILAMVFLLLVVIALITTSLSPSSDGSVTLNFTGVVLAIIASIVAFIPAVFYILPLIWLDRYDPEPLWLLALAFAWGALVAVVVSFIVNTGILLLVYQATDNAALAEVVGAVFSAPIFEEGSKGIGLLILLVYFRKYFDDILDGIVFAGVIALGFATVENVLYYGRAIGSAGTGGLMVLFVMRGILSPFAHVTFTAMTGIGCGIARESHNKAVRIITPVVGYFAAVALHALWNGMAVIGGLGGFLLGYLILEIPFFLIFVGFSLYVMYRQNKILKEMLALDVARGLIPAEHAAKATSAFRSSWWVLAGLFSQKFKPRNNYVRAIGKLGLSYWHIQRATAAQGQTASFQQNPILREEVLKWRDKV